MTRGIPGQVAALTTRVDNVEASQATLQRVVDDEILPVLREIERRATLALRVAQQTRRTRRTKK